MNSPKFEAPTASHTAGLPFAAVEVGYPCHGFCVVIATTADSIATLTGHERTNNALAFSPDGLKLACGGRDTRLIYLWNLTGPPHRETLGKATNGTVRFLAFTSDGETLISCGWYRIERWNLATRQRRPPIGHESYGGAISPDGRVLVVGWGPEAIRVTDILAEAGVIHLGGQSNVGVASISPDGRLIACGDDTNHIRL